MNEIRDIKHALYINLESRKDRKQHVESELEKIGVSATRFNAVKITNGALGCSLSHLKCLEIAKTNNWEHVLIVEDDILFLNPSVFINHFNIFLKKHKEWDVVLIGGNNIPPYKTIDNTCVKVTKCQTTTGYLVKNHYYDKLIDNFRNGINLLLKNPDKRILYAIDKYWFQLQEKDSWYLIIPLTVSQKEGYSDIENKLTNYTSLLTDLDKKHFFRNLPFQMNPL